MSQNPPRFGMPSVSRNITILYFEVKCLEKIKNRGWEELDGDISLGDVEQKFVYLHQAFGGLIQDLLELLLNKK
ncbi:hypothetical protein Ccrd_020143 [Cynara cardunculus var. scolymus]|uniref:Uncharacterized protein n=1 Tax=Cynara cardunculus var. scolymus TaxID=59895 RepID=A0A118K0L1_CYNCS|nr:hypothetical protein Ccrd_020143 [Cynara cardunculus var. scolymus]